MAVVVQECGIDTLTASTDKNNVKKLSRTFWVSGVYDPYDAMTASAGGVSIPSIGDAYVTQSSTTTNMLCTSITPRLEPSPDSNLYYVTVDYEESSGGNVTPYVDLEVWNIQGGSRTEHIIQLADVSDRTYYDGDNPTGSTDGGAGIDIGKFNNGNGDEYKGVDIYVPNATITITKFYTPATITSSFVNTRASAQCKINDASWPTAGKFLNMFSAGELLFSEFNIGLDDANLIPVTYTFLVNKNVGSYKMTYYTQSISGGNPEVAKTDVTFAKAGWQYVSGISRIMNNTTASTGIPAGSTMRRYQVTLDDVYESVSFATLLTGGGA